LKASALIVEPSVPVLTALRKAAEAVGCEVRSARTQDEAALALRDAPPDLLIASVGVVDGESICRLAKVALPLCPVVLVYAPDEADPDNRAAQAGADACLVGPLKQGPVASCLRAMLRIRDLKETVERLEKDLRKHVSELSLPGTRGKKASEFDFFKKTLLMEIKRSRRYRYPVAFLLVGVDGYREKLGGLEPARQQEILTEVLTFVAGGIRDIDLAVPFTDGRFLVFLPHTARKGAGVVAGRLRERLAQTSVEGLTASVGVAAYEPKHAAEGTGQNQPQVSFGTLMKEATDALAKAQILGGNRIETGETAPRSRISMG